MVEDLVRTVDGVVIVPVLEEVVAIEKRLPLKEENHIHRRPTVMVPDTPVTLRKQRAVVERLPNDSESTTEETLQERASIPQPLETTS